MPISKKNKASLPITAEQLDAKNGEAGKGSDLPVMLSIKEGVEKTNLSYEFLRYLCNTGKIKCFKYGRKYMINAASLAEFIENSCK